MYCYSLFLIKNFKATKLSSCHRNFPIFLFKQKKVNLKQTYNHNDKNLSHILHNLHIYKLGTARFLLYSQHHNSGASQNMTAQDIKHFELFDWTMVSRIAFDWLSKYTRHVWSIYVHLACTVMMLDVKCLVQCLIITFKFNQ